MHCPSMKDILHKLNKGVEMDVLTDLINFCDMLYGPVPLDVSILDMMSSISGGVVGLIINDEELVFFR